MQRNYLMANPDSLDVFEKTDSLFFVNFSSFFLFVFAMNFSKSLPHFLYFHRIHRCG